MQHAQAGAAGAGGLGVLGVSAGPTAMAVGPISAGGGGVGGQLLLSSSLPSSSSASSASAFPTASGSRPSVGSASKAATLLGSASMPNTPRTTVAAAPAANAGSASSAAASTSTSSNSNSNSSQLQHPQAAHGHNGGSHGPPSASHMPASGGAAPVHPSLQLHGTASAASATPSNGFAVAQLPASAAHAAPTPFSSSSSLLSSGLPPLSSSSASMDALVDGVSDSEVDSDDGALHPMAMRMIEEEEDEESIDDAQQLRGGRRGRRGEAGGGPMVSDLAGRRGGERASDAFYDDAPGRPDGGYPFAPPQAYGGYWPGLPYAPPLPPHLYGYPRAYPPALRAVHPHGAAQWSDGEHHSGSGLAGPTSPLFPSSLLLPPPSSPSLPSLSGWSSPSFLPSSSSSASALLSAPIAVRGVRTFVFCVATLNCSALLIRDASLQSFALFLLLANTVLALCVLTGKPFSLAILLQAAAPSQTFGLVKAAAKGERARVGAGGEGAEGFPETAAAAPPSASSSASSSSHSRAASSSSSSAPRHPTPPKATPPLSSPTSRTAPAVPQPPAAVPPFAVAATTAVAGSQPPLLPLALAPLPVDSSVASASAPPTAAEASLEAAAAGSLPSSAVSSAASSPVPSRAPSPTPSLQAAPVSPSPFSSSSPSYDSGPWTVAPLPLFTRGFVRKIPAGVSTRYSERPELATWCRTAGEQFMVRMGPNYRKTKAKSASAPSLYECVGLDIFQTDSKVDHIARLIRLPLPASRLKKRGDPLAGPKEEKRRKASAALAQAAAAYAAHLAAAPDPSAGVASAPPVDPAIAALLAEYPDGDFMDASDELDGEYVPTADDALIGVPPLWVINFQIPAYDPPMPMWGKKEEGEGYSVVLYYQLTEQARDDLRQNLTPAARLLKHFVQQVGDERMHGRYKSIPKIVNPDDCEVGRTVRSLITSYNAKPFLTGPWCHSFIKGPGYVEVDIDVHRFRYVARKGAHSFLESLKSMIIDIAFVVEGQDDDELPEQIQGATRIHFPSPQDAQNITHYLHMHNTSHA